MKGCHTPVTGSAPSMSLGSSGAMQSTLLPRTCPARSTGIRAAPSLISPGRRAAVASYGRIRSALPWMSRTGRACRSWAGRRGSRSAVCPRRPGGIGRINQLLPVRSHGSIRPPVVGPVFTGGGAGPRRRVAAAGARSELVVCDGRPQQDASRCWLLNTCRRTTATAQRRSAAQHL